MRLILKNSKILVVNKLFIKIGHFRKKPVKYFLITCIFLLTVFKISLIGSGFLAFPDEFRYAESGKALKDISEFKIKKAINDIFSTQGRPADAIIKIIPNAMQFITANIFKLNYYESNNSYPLFIFNFILYFIILIIHFKFSKLLLKDEILALISVLLFSSLTNSYIYLRHALPYDASLLVLYLMIYKIVKYTLNESNSFKISFFLGLFSFLGYLVYPGYFPLYIIAFLLLLFNNLSKNNILSHLFYSIYFGLGSLFCLFIFESLSRYVGHSYILEALSLSKTITQGSFEESFTFIFIYLFEVERLTGTIIIMTLIFFCLLIIHKIINKKFKQDSHIILVGIIVIGLYLAYASAGYFLHKMVFYGRLLHQYFPFICILSLYSINEIIKNYKKRVIIFLLISMIYILNFGISFIHYYSFSYPRDIGWELLNKYELNNIENQCEYENSWSVMPKKWDFRSLPPQSKSFKLSNKILVLNCSFIYPVNELSKYKLFLPVKNYILMKSKPYFLNYKAYQYEGCSVVDRINIDKFNFHIKIFSKK